MLFSRQTHAVISLAALTMSFTQAQANLGLFSTTANMNLKWEVGQTSELATEEVYRIEQATSSYFSQLLEEDNFSAFQEPNEVVKATVAVQNQRIEEDSLVFDSVVEVIHVGDQGIVDLAALLMFLTNKNTTNSSFSALDSMIDMDLSLDMVSFSGAEESVVISNISGEESTSKYTDSERTLIIVTSVLAFSLFALSIILIWVAGGWLALRKQVKVLIHREEELTRMTKQHEQELKMQPTASNETDEEQGENDDGTQFTNPSGILGVNPYYGRSGNGGSALDGLGIKMTPARPNRNGEAGSEIFTPMSETFSDTGRAPIGITSMRKLLPSAQNDDNRDSLGTFGIKRLEY